MLLGDQGFVGLHSYKSLQVHVNAKVQKTDNANYANI